MRRILIFLAFFAGIISLISCGSGSSSSSAPGGVNPGVPSEIQLLPAQYIAQTNSNILFKARVIDGNGKPLSNVPVTFTNISPIGTISASSAGSVSQSGATVVNTDPLGYASAKVFSSVPGFATVKSEVNAGTGFVRDQKTVYFTSSDVKTGLFPTLTLEVDSLPGNGIYNETSDFNLFETIFDDSVEVLATVFDIWGNPVAGDSILWGLDQNEGVILEPLNLTTNVNGQAKALVKDIPLSLRDTETFLNVYAFAGNGAANMVSLFLQPVGIDTLLSYLTADPPVVATKATSTITAVIFMSTGEPIFDGATINFTTTCGTVTPFAQTEGGIAEAEFTAPSTEGTCTITATLRGTVIGTVDVIVTTALTVFPTTQTVNGVAGGTATYTIFGGLAPYSVLSDNLSFLPVPSTVAASGDTFTVTVPANTPETTVSYLVRDSEGTTVTATLKITGAGALAVIPATQTIANPAVGNTAGYTIVGGTAPYTAFSSNPGVVTVGVAGSALTATVASVPASDTTVTITVYDNVGANKTATLILDVPPLIPLNVTPASATVTGIANPDGNTADDVTFFISGGIPDYTVVSDTPGVIASPGALGAGITQFTVDPEAVTSPVTVTLTVFDSVGTSKTVTVTVNPVFLSLTLDIYNVIGLANPDGDTSDDITFTVAGGTAPYIVTSSNPALTPDGTWSLGAPGSVTFDPNNVGATTSVTLTVVDNVGATATATLTIFPQTTGIVISVNRPNVIGVIDTSEPNATDDITFTVTGGSQPYIISKGASAVSFCTLSSNPCVPDDGPWPIALSGGTYSIDPQSVAVTTTVTLTVTDNVGAITTTTFDVHP